MHVSISYYFNEYTTHCVLQSPNRVDIKFIVCGKYEQFM